MKAALLVAILGLAGPDRTGPGTLTFSEPPQPRRGPTGWLRLGATTSVFVGGTLKYNLVFRGDPIFAHAGSASASLGTSVFAEAQAMRFLMIGVAVQYIATVQWSGAQSSTSTSTTDLYGGSGREIDILPRFGVAVPLKASRLRLLFSVAPGYSMIDAAGMVKAYANPGTATGFIIQTETGLLFSFSPHGFVSARASYQRGFQSNRVTSASTGETATAEMHSSYFGLHAGVGYWF